MAVEVEDLKIKAGSTAIDTIGVVVVVVVAAAVTMAVLGGNLIQFVQALV